MHRWLLLDDKLLTLNKSKKLVVILLTLNKSKNISHTDVKNISNNFADSKQPPKKDN